MSSNLNDKPSTIIYLQLILTMVVWGGTFVAGKIVAQNLSPFVAAFGRFAIASLCLWLLNIVQKNRLERLNYRQIFLLALLGLSGVLAYNTFFFLGLKDIAASRAGLIIALNPVTIALGSSLFWREKLSYLKLLGIFIALTGAVLVITKGDLQTAIAQGIGRGELYILGCVVSWVVYSLVGKLAMQQLSVVTTTSYAIWLGTLFLLPLAIWEQQNHLPNINWLTGLCLMYLGILGTVIAFNWYYIGIKILGAAKAGIFINLVPVFAAIFGFIFLQESFTPILFVGGGCVLVGVSLVNQPTD
ncbi:MAG: DMT family transporter [Pleurocapsa minor HA4230-MV1]|nr:DMT family transporter [Pleurocapsa minor HA4230-MV1]